MEEARETIAAVLGARPSEVIFTAGGTESDNLAIKGLYWARHDADPQRRHIVTTAVEHHAVLDAVTWLAEHEGAQIIYLPTEADGSVTVAALREVLEEHGSSVALVTVMWANNEVGTLFPIAELAAVAAEFDVPMHSDAIQAVGQVPVSFAESGLSAMSVAAHKFGGPTGVGALLLRRDAACVPLTHGGGQERDVRSGTPDVAGAVAMAAAATVAVETLDAKGARLRGLRDRLIDGVLAEIDDVVLNGARDARLPGNAHFTFRGCEGDSLLMLLDANGIECSTGSACTAGVAQPSHVLIAMGADAATARGSIRLSLGHTSVEADVDAALEVLPAAVARARQAALAAAGVVR
jgi:cysteine desulfurase